MKNHWLDAKTKLVGKLPPAFKETLEKVRNEKPNPKGGVFVPQKDLEKLREAMAQQKTSMGFAGHPFATKDATIPRTFRFLIEPKSHPDLRYMAKRVAINYYAKTIEMELYEHPNFQTHDYLLYLADSQNKNHELTLTAFDGCGIKLYLLHFKGVEPEDHRVEYDYAKSDVLTHKLTLTYDEMKRIDNIH